MKNQLLPYSFKWPGIILSLAGIFLAVLYTWFSFRITLPVFAVVSSFIETNYFVIIHTNVAEEIIMLSLLGGLSLVVFSREKDERRQWNVLRFHAMRKALIYNTLFLLFTVFFVFGNAFLMVLLLNLVSVFVLYLSFFYWLKRKSKI